MKKREWLHQDAISHASFPFNPVEARLQLLGFFISADQSYPGPVEMLVQTPDAKRLRVSHGGYAHMLNARNDRDMRDPDIAALPNASIKLGEVAYAVNPGQIIVGQDWQVRRELRRLVGAGHVPPSTALQVIDYLHQQPREVLYNRAYAAGGLEAYTNSQRWMELRDKIREKDICTGFRRRKPALQPA